MKARVVSIVRSRMYLLVVCFLLVGCASHVRVIDQEGQPLSDALVFTERSGFLFSPEKVGITRTDSRGKAQVVSRRGHIVKPGYHTVINGSEFDRHLTWQQPSYLSGEVVLFPIVDPGALDISIDSYRLVSSKWPHWSNFEIDACPSVNLQYGFASSIISATVKDGPLLIPSQRFYFSTGDTSHSKRTISEPDQLSFYCMDGDQINKIGIYTRTKLSFEGTNTHTLTLFIVEDIGLDTYIEPTLHCLKKSDLFLINYISSPSDLVLSDNLELSLQAVQEAMGCNSEYLESVYQKLQPYLN